MEGTVSIKAAGFHELNVAKQTQTFEDIWDSIAAGAENGRNLMTDIIVPMETITGKIVMLRGIKVMLDRLAPLNCSKNKPAGHSTGGPV